MKTPELETSTSCQLAVAELGYRLDPPNPCRKILGITGTGNRLAGPSMAPTPPMASPIGGHIAFGGGRPFIQGSWAYGTLGCLGIEGGGDEADEGGLGADAALGAEDDL